MNTQRTLIVDDHEARLLAGLIRQALRKTDRNQISARAVFGDAYESTRHDARRDTLERLYRQLGKDPARITNRPD